MRRRASEPVRGTCARRMPRRSRGAGVVVDVMHGCRAVRDREPRGVEADALAPPPMISTEPPGRSRKGMTTLRHASARLSLAAATRKGGTPPGLGRACGQRTGRVARRPPCHPRTGRRTEPYAASVARVVVAHLDVGLVDMVHSRRRRPPTAQRPADRPGRCTPLPTARTRATHSWPIANGPLNGTRPEQPTTGSMARTAIPACIRRDTGRWIGRVSPSQRPAMKAARSRRRVLSGSARHDRARQDGRCG